MRERFILVAKKYLIVLTIGLAYLAWVLLTGLRIPCPVYSALGLKCPGCGVTRMIVSLVKLDFQAAFNYNSFLFLTSPVILLCIFVPEYHFIKYGEYKTGWIKYLIWAELLLTLAYGVVRNLPLG